jgi:hypothetical protein
MSLFLTEEEMKSQADPKNWRKGVAARQVKDIFSSPRTSDNERVFQYTTRQAPKLITITTPFHFKKTTRPPLARPTIRAPILDETEDDPPYAPKTP